jgi:hypothetical protein
VCWLVLPCQSSQQQLGVGTRPLERKEADGSVIEVINL